ncbi:MAG: sigma-70 family RNA polymerase sigma factor [Sedimentisphaerales bacterium]|nr:sigma-70 family RNA polymerase sigma factor [Sedimentisphaerales bacterium]
MNPDCEHKTQSLVTLAKEGDKLAIEQLCRIYGERVRRIVRLRIDRKLRSKIDSVDVVQDALILAMGGLKDFTYKNEGDFLRWLSKIAENKLHDILDKFYTEKRDIRREIPFKKVDNNPEEGSFIAAEPLDTTTPSVLLFKKEQLDRLESAIDDLKPDYREVIYLSRIERLSNAEIAEKLGKSKGAVAMLLSRALAALTAAYEKS